MLLSELTEGATDGVVNFGLSMPWGLQVAAAYILQVAASYSQLHSLVSFGERNVPTLDPALAGALAAGGTGRILLNTIFQEMVRPNLSGLTIVADQSRMSRQVDVSESMMIMPGKEEVGKIYNTDNAVPRPRQWELSGYIAPSLFLTDNGLILKPSILVQVGLLDSLAKARRPVLYKSMLNFLWNYVLVEDYSVEEMSTATNVLKVRIGLKEFVGFFPEGVGAGTPIDASAIAVGGVLGVVAAAAATVAIVDTAAGSKTPPAPPAPPAPLFDIEIDPSGSFEFTKGFYGNYTPIPETVTITNIGNQPTGELTLNLSGPNADSFDLSATTIAELEPEATETFTVAPKSSLYAGTYAATVTVEIPHRSSKTLDVTFTLELEGE